MLRPLDSSPRISRFLRWISTAMAKHRGLPMMVGTGLVIFSALVFGVVIPVLVASNRLDSTVLWLCLPLALLHLGIFVGFLGFMLSAPLGEAHRSSR
jgi:hypothetical protein